MKQVSARAAGACAVAVLLGAVGISALKAQQPPTVKRNVLLKEDMSIPGREAIMALVELPPGAAEGRHSHPADVYVFVQEGEVSLEAEGKPTATLKAGDVFHIAPGQVHQAINHSGAAAKLAAVFIAEKGKPLTTQAR